MQNTVATTKIIINTTNKKPPIEPITIDTTGRVTGTAVGNRVIDITMGGVKDITAEVVAAGDGSIERAKELSSDVVLLWK